MSLYACRSCGTVSADDDVCYVCGSERFDEACCDYAEEEEGYECEECGDTFDSERGLNSHKRVHED